MTSMYDALVIGGGPGGGTAALLLSRAGFRTALIERKTFPRRKVCGEYLSATNLDLIAALGLREVFSDRAGPPVTHVGFFAGESVLQSELPRPSSATGWGRALSREHLDTLLIEHAVRRGTTLFQPASAIGLTGGPGDYRLRVRTDAGDVELAGRTVIAAHGSWDTGTLPTQLSRERLRPSSLLGFKAHFQNSRLQAGLMPLLAFPDGYGGMVHCEDGKTSISFCVRSDRLTDLRKARSGEAAGIAFDHVMQSCRGVRESLEGVERVGPFLSTGPLRPGIRVRAEGGIFRVGNSAGEAHPVVAEGISMAMQAAWLVADHLAGWHQAGADPRDLNDVGRSYAAAWRSAFAPRLRASRAIAHWAMRPTAVSFSLPAMRAFPRLLTWGARLSGKAKTVVRKR